MDDFVNKIQLIYDKLGDTISQRIFIDRMVYSLTGHLESLKSVIRTFPSGREFLERLNQAIATKRKICIFGTGIWGKSILASNPDVDFFAL